MKRNMFVAAVAALFTIVFVSACTLGFEPAWMAKSGKTAISFQVATINPDSSASLGRAVVQGGGYLFIKTIGGPASARSTYYGPYPASAGQLVTTSEIPAGNYAAMGFIYCSIDLSTVSGFDELMASMTDSSMGESFSPSGDIALALESASGNYKTDVVIEEGKINTFSFTMMPFGSSTSSGLSQTFTPRVPGQIERKFVSLSGISSTSTIPGLAVTSIDCSVTANVTAAVMGTVALYDGNGVLIQSFAPDTIAPYTTKTYSVPYTMPVYVPGTMMNTGLYFYYECTTSSTAALNFSPVLTSTGTGNIYYVSQSGGGLSDGSSIANACTLSEALNTYIPNNSLITVDAPAVIILTENISDAEMSPYQIDKPVMITSSGIARTISLGYNRSSSFINVITGGSLVLQNATIGATGSFNAGMGLVSVSTSGTFDLGSGGVLANNVAIVNNAGGGVTVNGGEFRMNGGSINGCSSINGGGVYVNSGYSYIWGGTISGCTASTGSGGGIYVASGANFTISDSTLSTGFIPSITGCTAVSGGGLYCASGSIVKRRTAFMPDFDETVGYLDIATISGVGKSIQGNLPDDFVFLP